MAINVPDISDVGINEQLLAQQLQWCEQVLQLTRRRLVERDRQMVREYLRRHDLGGEDLRFALELGVQLLVK